MSLVNKKKELQIDAIFNFLKAIASANPMQNPYEIMEEIPIPYETNITVVLKKNGYYEDTRRGIWKYCGPKAEEITRDDAILVLEYARERSKSYNRKSRKKAEMLDDIVPEKEQTSNADKLWRYVDWCYDNGVRPSKQQYELLIDLSQKI